ncbi:MAG: hypothetical protein M3Z01_04730 [Thermoproteota archaeon]|nr:hypothetical protein [Thermoproteota archaeon]
MDDDEWRQVINIFDNGGWNASCSDGKFYSASCGKPMVYVITNADIIITSRSDNIALNFKYLSIKEIPVN